MVGERRVSFELRKEAKFLYLAGGSIHLSMAKLDAQT